MVKKAAVWLIITHVIMNTFCNHAPPIEFRKEHITIEIIDDHIAVTGVYIFHNTRARPQRATFFYPFPVDPNHHYPDTFIAPNANTKTSGGMYYDLVIDAHTSKPCTISYIQRVQNPSFTYITTTTREWRHPIAQADFTIIAPDSLHITVNYPVHTQKKQGTQCVYHIRYKNFYPDEDLIIHWSATP